MRIVTSHALALMLRIRAALTFLWIFAGYAEPVGVLGRIVVAVPDADPVKPSLAA